MHQASRSAGRTTLLRLAGALSLLLLAACGPTPTPAPGTPAPVTTIVAATAPATAAATTTVNSTLAPATVSAASPSPVASPTPAGSHALTLCLVGEPQSLYRYARPETNRDHLLAALYDGPIDSANFGFQPVLFDHLPSLANGEAVVRATTVLSGETVVDALGRVQPLRPGLVARQQDGTPITYDGGPAGLPLPQMVVTFTLRPGLRWSDGVPLTADDSAFAFDISRSPDSFDPMRATANRTQSYQALDDRTIVWTGLPGDLDPLYATNFWPPLPRHQLGSLNAAQIAASDQAARAPLGWGPFVLAAWNPGQSIVMQRNPNYWRTSEGLPRLDQVTYRFLAAPADLAAGLRNGSCDIAPSGPAMDQIWGDLQADAKSGHVNLDNVPGAALDHLDFNLLPSPADTGTAQTGLFQDLRIRQAILACLDRQKLPGFPADPNLPLSHFDLYTNQISFDPARGRALLAQAGWTDSNGDGVLDQGGSALTPILAGDEAHQPLMQAIQSQLKTNCGLALKLETLTVADLQGNWPDGVVFGRRFDLAVFAWQVGALPPCALFTSAEIASDGNPGGANNTGYSNPDFDAACQHAVFPLDDGASTAANLAAQHLLARDLPMLPLSFQLRHGAFRPAVQGYVLDPSSPSELSNIEQLQILP